MPPYIYDELTKIFFTVYANDSTPEKDSYRILDNFIVPMEKEFDKWSYPFQDTTKRLVHNLVTRMSSDFKNIIDPARSANWTYVLNFDKFLHVFSNIIKLNAHFDERSIHIGLAGSANYLPENIIINLNSQPIDTYDGQGNEKILYYTPNARNIFQKLIEKWGNDRASLVIPTRDLLQLLPRTSLLTEYRVTVFSKGSLMYFMNQFLILILASFKSEKDNTSLLSIEAHPELKPLYDSVKVFLNTPNPCTKNVGGLLKDAIVEGQKKLNLTQDKIDGNKTELVKLVKAFNLPCAKGPSDIISHFCIADFFPSYATMTNSTSYSYGYDIERHDSYYKYRKDLYGNGYYHEYDSVRDGLREYLLQDFWNL